MEKILVGYAGDEAGRDAVTLTAQIAAALGSEITVVYPYSPLLSSVPADAAEERVREEVRAVVPDSQSVGAGDLSLEWLIVADPRLAQHGEL